MLSVISINAVAGIDHRWSGCSKERVSAIAKCRTVHLLVNNGPNDIQKSIKQRDDCEDKVWAQYDTCTLKVIETIGKSM